MTVADKIVFTLCVVLAAISGASFGWYSVAKRAVRWEERLVESGRLKKSSQEMMNEMTWELRHPVHATLLLLWMVFGQVVIPGGLLIYLIGLWGSR